MNNLHKLFQLVKGKKRYQRLFQTLHSIALSGMNYGNGSELDDSGEMSTLDYMKNILRAKKNITLFDVGANKGGYTLALLKAFKGDHVQVHSFEPSRSTFNHLTNTLADCPQVILNNFALGEKEDAIKLFTNAQLSGLASVYQRNLEHFNIQMDQVEEISVTSIDNYCMERGVKEIDFLKLDVEGHELKVLKGAEHMIQKDKIKFIQFEFGGCNIDSRSYFHDFFYLLKDKYTIYRIIKDGLAEIKTYKEIHEIFITVNYLAVHK